MVMEFPRGCTVPHVTKVDLKPATVAGIAVRRRSQFGVRTEEESMSAKAVRSVTIHAATSAGNIIRTTA